MTSSSSTRTTSTFGVEDWVAVARRLSTRTWADVADEADLFAVMAACEAAYAERDGCYLHEEAHARAAVLVIWLTRRPPLVEDNERVTLATAIEFLRRQDHRWTDVTNPAGWHELITAPDVTVTAVQQWLRHRTRKET